MAGCGWCCWLVLAGWANPMRNALRNRRCLAVRGAHWSFIGLSLVFHCISARAVHLCADHKKIRKLIRFLAEKKQKHAEAGSGKARTIVFCNKVCLSLHFTAFHCAFTVLHCLSPRFCRSRQPSS